MGTDIYWILERQDWNDQWHCVMSESYLLRSPKDRLSASVATRDYPLFGVLSGVRQDPPSDGYLTTDGLPPNLSTAAQILCNAFEKANVGYLLGKRLRDHPLALKWLDLLIKADEAGEFSEILAQPFGQEDHIGFTDLARTESFHAKIERLEHSKSLKPFQNESAWRMIVFYSP